MQDLNLALAAGTERGSPLLFGAGVWPGRRVLVSPMLVSSPLPPLPLWVGLVLLRLRTLQQHHSAHGPPTGLHFYRALPLRTRFPGPGMSFLSGAA